jgi:hypothetical protein
VPLYVYFIHECKEGRKYELPPCVAEQQGRPGLFAGMCKDGRAACHSAGGAVSTATSCTNCSYRSPLFGPPTATNAN